MNPFRKNPFARKTDKTCKTTCSLLVSPSASPACTNTTTHINQHIPSVMSDTSSPSSLTIVELFQSQGCSSCPSAESTLHSLLPRTPNTLLLTYPVTYWDHLGWRDTFGCLAWDQRQREYSARWGRGGVFTPQVVVDGLADGVGNRESGALDILRRGEREKSALLTRVEIVVDMEEGEIRVAGEVGGSGAGVYDVLVVVYDSREQKVEIKRGENQGRTLAHRNIVMGIQKIGEWRGGSVAFEFPERRRGEEELEKVVILQSGVGGAIVAAQKV